MIPYDNLIFFKMNTIFLKFLILLVVYKNANTSLPIIIWHGMGDTCCNPLTLGIIIKLLHYKLPNTHVLSLKFGNTFLEDMEDSYFLNVNTQIQQVCELIKNDTNLKDGYNAIGFSQGAQFLRGLAQRCPYPPMYNLISIGGQHQGVYGLPRCRDNFKTCERIKWILDKMAYTDFAQANIVQAQYWHDPYNMSEYRAKSTFLADINQERSFNASYKENLMKLNLFVMVKFTLDTIVFPPDSEWFGFYAPGQAREIISLQNSSIYKDDLLGLKTMNEAGRIVFLSYPGDHLRFDIPWFEKSIISPYLNVSRIPPQSRSRKFPEFDERDDVIVSNSVDR